MAIAPREDGEIIGASAANGKDDSHVVHQHLAKGQRRSFFRASCARTDLTAALSVWTSGSGKTVSISGASDTGDLPIFRVHWAAVSINGIPLGCDWRGL
jgi:hypothetical protein